MTQASSLAARLVFADRGRVCRGSRRAVQFGFGLVELIGVPLLAALGETRQEAIRGVSHVLAKTAADRRLLVRLKELGRCSGHGRRWYKTPEDFGGRPLGR